MTHLLKLATASALALTLAACASTNNDKYSVGVDDDDRFSSSEDGSNIELSDAQTFGMNDNDRFDTMSSRERRMEMDRFRRVNERDATMMRDGSMKMRDGTIVMRDGSMRMRDGRMVMSDGTIRMSNGSMMNRSTPPKSDATIYTGARMAPNYTTVMGAVSANGLNTMLDDDSTEYTVFAPSNSSFSGMDMNRISSADQKALLSGHVIKGRVSSSDISAQLNSGRDYTVRTEGGQNLRFFRDGDMIKVADENGYTYTVDNADMEFSNGYVHGIDGVLGRTY